MLQKIRFYIGCCLTASTLLSAAKAAPIITYQSLPDRVRKQNPDLAAARFRIDEAIGRMNQAGRLSNPELSIDASHDTRFKERSLTIGFSQKFPITHRLQLEKSIGKIEVQTATAEIKDMERTLVAEARLALVDFLSLSQRRKLLREQIQLSEEFSNSLKALAEKGEISIIDAGQARLQNLQITTELRELDAEEKVLNGIIKPLLGMALNEPVIIGGNLERIEATDLPINLDRRGDVRAARSSIDGAIQGVELEKARRYADLEVGGFASIERSEDAPGGYKNEGIVGVGITIPLPFWDKNEGNIEAAKAKVSRKKLELTALQETILQKSQSSNEEMREWAGLIQEIDRTLIPEVAQQYQLAEKSYREGLTDLQTVLRSREQKLKLQSSRITALKNFHKARATYESALGL
ncbi:TolC family protein [Verrucomicrobiaceae bacterium 227]